MYIAQRDFKIEVKYLKNWISSANTRAASKNWLVFQQDFDWLMDEIDNDKAGKVAFVIGWFNCVDSFHFATYFWKWVILPNHYIDNKLYKKSILGLK